MTRALLFVLLLLPLQSHALDSSSGRALPKGAVLLSWVPIAGSKGDIAVTYRTSAPFVGVESNVNGQNRLIWSQREAGKPERLKSSPHSGVFFVLTADGAPARSCVSAYFVSGSSIRNDLTGGSSQSTCGDKGVSLGRNRVIVRNIDAVHKGSVPYRYESLFSWSANRFHFTSTTRVPDYPHNTYPVPNGTIRNSHGDLILLKLELVDTAQQCMRGLMDRKSLDQDSGMLFIWKQPTQESFWMENTYVPLTVAFLDSNGKILEMQDMAPLTTNLHQPSEAYVYAIEVNQGFFRDSGIRVSDTIHLQVQQPKTDCTVVK